MQTQSFVLSCWNPNNANPSSTTITRSFSVNFEHECKDAFTGSDLNEIAFINSPYTMYAYEEFTLEWTGGTTNLVGCSEPYIRMPIEDYLQYTPPIGPHGGFTTPT